MRCSEIYIARVIYRLYDLVNSSIINPLWTSDHGINIETTRPSGRTTPFFFRGLYYAWNTTSIDQAHLNSGAAEFIESYFGVQVSHIVSCKFVDMFSG